MTRSHFPTRMHLSSSFSHSSISTGFSVEHLRRFEHLKHRVSFLSAHHRIRKDFVIHLVKENLEMLRKNGLELRSCFFPVRCGDGEAFLQPRGKEPVFHALTLHGMPTAGKFKFTPIIKLETRKQSVAFEINFPSLCKAV